MILTSTNWPYVCFKRAPLHHEIYVPDGVNISSIDEDTCPLECVAFDHNDYMQLLWTSASELPGLLLAALLVDRIGKKAGFSLLMLLSFSCSLPSYSSLFLPGCYRV